MVQKKAAVCGEERCVTSLKTAAKETRMSPDQMERNVTVYFPTEFYDWMESDDKQFQQLQMSEAAHMGHISTTCNKYWYQCTCPNIGA